MSKLTFAAILSVLALNMALGGQSITVSAPAAGQEFCLGGTCKITWTKSGVQPATVSIRLRRAGAPSSEAAVLQIAGGVANNGSYAWPIPGSLAGGDYFIRIRAVGSTVIGDSANFRIKACSLPTREELPLRYPQNRPIPPTVLRALLAGRITGLALSPNNVVQRGSQLTALVSGQGNGDAFRVSWGDGSSEVVNQPAFDSHPAGVAVRHTYGYWGGLKTVRVEGIGNCSGGAEAQIIVEPQRFMLGFGAPTTSACGKVPGVPPVRKGSLVTITTGPTKMDFGCIFGGCVYGPDGQPNTSAPAGYPFPGMRKYSLVVRLGSQVVQGGERFSFTADQEAFLEVCANDNDLSGNSGAWGVFIVVNESML